MRQAAAPPWLKKRLLYSENLGTMKETLSASGVATVCEESLCPNLNECFSKKQLTFLILGGICTRSCGFCSVEKALPRDVRADEPQKILEAVKKLGLKYVVITSVTRDDLEDGGSSQFAKVITAIKGYSQNIKIEALVPDFKGRDESIKEVLRSQPDIFSHNIETVERLYPVARSNSDYKRSLGLLKMAKDLEPCQLTKSSLMLGLGEREEEVIDTIKDLKGVACDILTIGQYLRPRKENLLSKRLVRPEEFERYVKIGYGLGFKHVSSGPFVRSSYFAETIYESVLQKSEDTNDRCKTAVLG